VKLNNTIETNWLIQLSKKKIKEYVDTQIEKQVKSIQIQYLKDHFLTREEFLDAMNKLDKRFEAMQEQMDKRFDQMDKRFEAMQEQMDKRFEQMDKRFEAMQEQMDKRFEQMDKRFEAMQEQMDKRFEAMQEQMDKRFEQMDKRFDALQEQIDKRFEKVYERFEQMDFGRAEIVEGILYIVVKRELKKRGHDVKLKTRQHFTDEKYEVHPDTKDVEIDMLHLSPNIIGEATLKLTDVEKLRTFIRKIQFIESYYGESFERYFFCYTIYDDVRAEIKPLLEKYRIELIIPEKS